MQGVGFRYTTRNLAINYDVTGFVRNLPDGRVELVAEGPEPQVADFVQAVGDRMKHHICEQDNRTEPASGRGHRSRRMYRTWVITRHTFAESVSQPIYSLLLGVGSALLVIFMFLPFFTLGEDTVMFKSVGLDVILLLVLLTELLFFRKEKFRTNTA